MKILKKLNEIVKATNESIKRFQLKMMQKKMEREFIREEAEKELLKR